jgi:Zn finger protein HypA/HybF involved in hydrogenase expression
MEIFIVIIIIAIIVASMSAPSTKTYSGGPSISLNEITYPEHIKCEHCEERVYPTPATIDSSTWDLKCPHCKEIAYKHPKREERQQQIEDMLNW